MDYKELVKAVQTKNYHLESKMICVFDYIQCKNIQSIYTIL